MSKIGISLIVKDDTEYDYLKNLLHSLRRRINDVYITVTNEPSDKIKKLIEKKGAHWNYFKWINDFGAARQFGFDNLPKEYDYIFTCDADDIIEHAGNLDRIVWNMIKADADFCYVTYVTARSQEYGDMIINVPRVTKRNAGKWVRPIHEVWVGNNPENFIIDGGKNIRCIHTKDDPTPGEQRNLKMLLEIKDKTDEDRRYIASSYISLKELDKALEWLEQIKDDFGFYFNVCQTISNIYVFKRNFDKARERAEELIKLHGDYSDAWFFYGSLLIKEKKYEEALEKYLEGFKRKAMRTIITDSSHSHMINPLGKTAFLYEILGQHEKAVWTVKVLNKIAPNLQKVKELTELILDENKIMEGYEDIFKEDINANG